MNIDMEIRMGNEDYNVFPTAILEYEVVTDRAIEFLIKAKELYSVLCNKYNFSENDLSLISEQIEHYVVCIGFLYVSNKLEKDSDIIDLKQTKPIRLTQYSIKEKNVSYKEFMEYVYIHQIQLDKVLFITLYDHDTHDLIFKSKYDGLIAEIA